MDLNQQDFLSTIRWNFLRKIRVNLLPLQRVFQDVKLLLLLVKFCVRLLCGSFFFQVALAQGINPNGPLFMQSIAPAGGQVNSATVNSLSPSAMANGKASSADPLELKANQQKKVKDEEAGLVKNKEPIPLSIFQTFLLQTIGKSLPIYGQKLFQLDKLYSEIETTNIPIDYVLGPGDELLVKIYSSAIDLEQRFIINRDGMIVLPKLGPLSLAGVRVGDIENRLKNELSKSLTDFNLYVSMGQLRGIEVYLTGQASIPGKHNLSSVSTLISALFATGGPASNGSMREIQLIRAGKQVANIDLYEFIQKGNKGIDLRLLSGDVIHIPSIGPQVAVLGAIPTPAIFELPRNKMTSIGDVLSLADGLTAFTNIFEANLERVDPVKSPAFSVQTIQLDANGLKTIMRNGDVLNLQAIKPSFSNAIGLKILNAPVKRIPIPKEIARVTDIIPSKDYLLTAAYFYRRLNLGKAPIVLSDLLYPPPTTPPPPTILSDLERIKDNGLYDQINFESIIIERIEPVTLKSQLISFNLERAIANPHSSDNVQLLPGDTITVFNQKDILAPLERQMKVVLIQGEVSAPGIYQTNGSETLRDLVKKAGGFTSNAYLFGTELARESIKQGQKKNLEIVIKRLEDQASLELRESTSNLVSDQQGTLQSVRTQNQARLKERIMFLRNASPTGRLALGLDPKRPQLPDLKLENGDQVLIPSTPSNIFVSGAVYNESALVFQPGRTVSEYLKLSGVARNADLSAIFVVRADGTLESQDFSKLIFKTNLDKVELNPGDTIFVPEKTIVESGYSAFMRGFKDWTQVLFQLGLSAAAIKVIK